MAAPTGSAILGRHLDVIEKALRDAFRDDHSPLGAAGRYVMGWEDAAGEPLVTGGKRIRPALCLFAAEAVGGDPNDALPGGVAIELVHNFSLVHDEIQDEDRVRHNRPTMFDRVGAGQAINVGDYLFTRAIQSLADGPGPADRRMAALAVLNDAIGRMIGGQWLDIAFESRDDVTVDEYLAMVAGKTGALLAAPLEIGAILAGATPETAHDLGVWGAHVGAAFQAQDDYLGIWGDPAVTGKSNTGDIARKKKTLPVIHGMNNAQAGPVVRAAYAAAVVSGDQIGGVVRALEKAGSDTYCRERAKQQASEADRLLETLPVTQITRGELHAIARYLVERDA